MTRVAVVTDSASDLSAEAARSAGVRVVPLHVTFGLESLRDGVELTAEAFWQRMEAARELPTTASPPPAALAAAYTEAAEDGAESVLSVHLSAALSRTVDSARQAAGESPVPVEIVDSRSVSAGEGLVALAAARTASAGRDLAEVATAARSAVERLHVAAMLDTVEFLKRGGRLGAARAALSELLRIRPVLSLDRGEPVLLARPRTRSKGLEEVLARTVGPAEEAAVFHSAAPEVDEVALRVAEACGVRPRVGLIGAVTGTHLGPRALGVAVIRAQ